MLTMIYYEIIHSPSGFYSKSPYHPMTSIPYAPCMEYESLHLPQKSTSFVGVHIPAPWFANLGMA